MVLSNMLYHAVQYQFWTKVFLFSELAFNLSENIPKPDMISYR
jgi:hypothetical protein